MKPKRSLHVAVLLAAGCALAAWLHQLGTETARHGEAIQLAQEVFADPIGEGDRPIGGPMAYGEPVGNGPIGGPMMYGAPVGDAPIGGPMMYGAPVGDAPIGGPAMYGAPVDSGSDGDAIGGDTLY